MAMRETVRSLRAYFILSAVLSAFFNLRVLTVGRGGLALFIGAVGLAFAAAFLYVGVRLRNLLTEAPSRVTNLLIAAALFAVVLFGAELALGAGAGSVPMLLFSLLILGYLFANVRRLAAESRPESPGAAAAAGGATETERC